MSHPPAIFVASHRSSHFAADRAIPLNQELGWVDLGSPIGLHRARIVARDGLRIEVDALEAIDGTPVVDVKPAIDWPT
jgi:tRNA-methyltransferase O